MEYVHLKASFVVLGGVVACIHHKDDAVGNKTIAFRNVSPAEIWSVQAVFVADAPDNCNTG